MNGRAGELFLLLRVTGTDWHEINFFQNRTHGFAVMLDGFQRFGVVLVSQIDIFVILVSQIAGINARLIFKIFIKTLGIFLVFSGFQSFFFEINSLNLFLQIVLSLCIKCNLLNYRET